MGLRVPRAEDSALSTFRSFLAETDTRVTLPADRCDRNPFMNPQPYQTPPRWWPSRLSPAFVRVWGVMRRRDLRKQGITEIDVAGLDHVTKALADGAGVLIFANHSFHYDSYVLIEAGLRGGWCAEFLTAWQVFALTGPCGKWLLQRHGCFSINREGTDTQAFRQAVSVLVSAPHPLVIFPEGDIYHSNDRVLPFREGGAAIALSARKRAKRSILAIPCAMKCFYTADPTAELVETMNRLESHIRWRPRPDLPLLERIYRFGSGFLAVKEVEFIGRAQTGSIPDRLRHLANTILTQIQQRQGLPDKGATFAERVRHLRGHLIRLMEEIDRTSGRRTSTERLSPTELDRLKGLQREMQDLFFVTQLSSYHGDYSAEKPTVERMAETIDKFEEDFFEMQAPTPRGRRRALVRFGKPLSLSEQQRSSGELTMRMERSVQQLLDEINVV